MNEYGVVNQSVKMEQIMIKTLIYFIFFAAILMLCNQFIFKPIHCYYKSTATVTAVHRDFIELTCYYYHKVLKDNYFPDTVSIQNVWFPFILLFQAITFLIPKFLLDQSVQFNNLLIKCKHENYLAIARYIHRLRNYKTVYYFIFIKCLTIGICCIHIYYVYVFLFLSDTNYILKVLKGIFLVNQEKEYNAVFNPMIQCNINVEGSVNYSSSYITSNCIIHGNVLFEKVFAIVLIMCSILLMVNLIDILELKIILNDHHFLQRYKSVLIKELESDNFSKYINYNIRFLLFIVERKVGLYLAAQVIMCLNNLFNNLTIKSN